MGGSRTLPILALAACLCGAQAQARCSRPLRVPVSVTGMSVIADGDKIGGIYPDLLQAVSARTGCLFKLSIVPRARQEALFASGEADLLMPATRTPRRDKWGYFVPVAASRPTMISLHSERAPVSSVDELLKRTELRVVIVRGYDYGDTYNELIQRLGEQGRVMVETDPVGVARRMQAGMADVTIMAPTILYGAIRADARIAGLQDRLRVEPLEGLAWGESGIYIARRAISAADRAQLEAAIAGVVKSGVIWESFKRYYPASLLAGAIRPH